MTDTLEFLAWSRSEEDLSALRESIGVFGAGRAGLSVHIRSPRPEMMWAEIVQTAMHGEGTGIGEVGSTYISSLVGMQDLRPFSPDEVAWLGGGTAFIQPLWHAGYVIDDTRPWAIPWTADTRAIFYRRDLLQGAGLDEAGAFQSFEALEQTLLALKRAGVQVPLTMGTTSGQVLAPFAASWVWGFGGDFIRPGLRNVAFDAPTSRRGLLAYFSLGNHLSAPAQKLDSAASDLLFCSGTAAVSFSGCWMLREIDSLAAPEVRDNLGIAPMPGVPFIGGTHLVIWKHCLQEQLALDLIRYLVSKPTLLGLPRNLLVPARLDVLNAPGLVSRSFHRALNQSIKTGRSFPAMALWDQIENRFGQMLATIWESLADRPGTDLENLIDDPLNTLASRLNLTLGLRR